MTGEAPDMFNYSDLLQPGDYDVAPWSSIWEEVRDFAKFATPFIEDAACDCHPGGWAGTEYLDAERCHRCSLLLVARHLAAVGEDTP
jgi:hypothetical protein